MRASSKNSDKTHAKNGDTRSHEPIDHCVKNKGFRNDHTY